MEAAIPAMSADELIKSMPELLKQGLEVYNTLKADMQKALGLKAYAKHLTHITRALKEINEHLDDKQQAIAKKLDKAYGLSQEGMEKATVVVSIIKTQCSALVELLSESNPGEKHDKLWSACQYFSGFAKEMDVKVNEAQDVLRKASHTLYSTQNDIRTIIDTLKRVQDNFIAEEKAAAAKVRTEAYTGAMAGLVAGPLGLIISYSIAAGVTEGLTIPNIEEDFANQQKTLDGYVDSFEEMQSETKDLQERLDTKRKQLIEIHSKLSTTGSLAGNSALKSMPMIHFNTVRQSAEGLVKACDKFLETLQ